MAHDLPLVTGLDTEKSKKSIDSVRIFREFTFRISFGIFQMQYT